MLGSIDCMHWEWRNGPKALHGKLKRKDHKHPTLMLEAVADQKLWIWHAYFGVLGANNDLNVLFGSSLFDDELADTTSEFAWDEKTLKFKGVQESVRKDIERAFGVLKGCKGIARQPAHAYLVNALKRIMYCCIILNNMILDDEGFEVDLRDLFVSPEPNIQRTWVERCDLLVRKTKELRDRKMHIDLRQDLMVHLWNNH
nr:hypothetical protein [Tanacetum cinerariifolium]GEX72944.1 hypothetical protein [Tanacetum cinerariifolium]